MTELPTPAAAIAPQAHPARSVLGYAMLTALMIVSQIVVFIPAAIFACGIRSGRRVATAAVAIGGVLAFLVAMQSGRVPNAAAIDTRMAYAYVLGVLLAIAVPALAVLSMVERREAFGRVLMMAMALSIGGFALTEGFMRVVGGFSPYAEQLSRVQQTSAQFMTIYQKAGIPQSFLRLLQKWMEIGLPAFLLIEVVVAFVFSLVLFGRLKAWREFITTREPAGPSAPYLFRNLSLPEWLLFLFVFGGLTPLVKGLLQTVTANTLAVVVFLYLVQGLAIFRALLTAIGAGFVGVMFGYIVLGFLTVTGIAPLLLSIAGIFDSFFDFRHFKRKDHSHESHSD